MNKKLISLLMALSMVAAEAVVFAQSDAATTNTSVVEEATQVTQTQTTETKEEVTEDVTEEEIVEENTVTKEVVVSESFDEGIANWSVLSGKGFNAKGLALHFKNKQTSETNNIVMSRALSIQNADLEFDLKIASGSVYAGVIFRAEEDKSMYQVRFYKNEGKAVLLKRVNGGDLVEIRRANAKIKSDEYSKVGIRLVDNKISVRVDGKAIFADVKDNSLKTGYVGFDAYCAEATIDNVEIVKYSNVDYDKIEIDPEAAGKVKNIYVAAAGSSGDGTRDNPFVNIEDARKAAIKAKRNGNTANVIFKEGTYVLDGALKFTSVDSGTQGAPITYKAEEGAKVVLTAASEIDHSKATPVKGKMENRVHADAKGKLIQLKLSTDTFPKALIEFAEAAWNGTAMNASRLKPPMIFLNEHQQTVAKWPNDDYESILDCEPGAKTSGDMNKGGAIQFANTEPYNWTKAERLFVEGYLGNFWTSEWAPVKEIDVEENKIRLKYRTAYGVAAKRRWSVVNLIEELDLPGEYYIDSEERMLYLYPPHNLTSTDKLSVARIQNIIEVSGAEYINFEGLELTMAGADPNVKDATLDSGNGIVLDKDCKYINIKDCTISNVGNSGIFLKGNYNVVDGCHIYNTGVDGISIEEAGDRANLIPSGIVVQNSVISDVVNNTGRNAYGGIRINHTTVDVHIRNNIIHNMPNNAIRYNGNGHQFYHNEFSSVCTLTADAGALYSGRTWVDWGCSAYENYFHDVGMTESEATHLSHAMYWDDNQTGQDFSRNIIFANNKALCKANHISGGSHTFVGNTTVACEEAIFYDPRNSRTADEWLSPSILINEMCWGLVDAFSPPFMEKYPEMSKQLDKIKAANRMVFDAEIRGNLFVDTLGNGAHDRVRKDYIYLNNVDLPDIHEEDYDEIFVDPANHDFRVTDEARKKYNLPDEILGEEFDLNQIGLQKDFVLPKENMVLELLAPAKETTGLQPSRTTLAWTKTPSADAYRWEISTDPNFETVTDYGETFMRAVSPEGLAPNTTYYWRVTAVNKSRQIGCETESKVWSFTTGKDILITEPLENKISQTKVALNALKEGTAVGQYKTGTKQYVAETIAKAESVLKDENATQAMLDSTITDINKVMQGLDEFINVGYTTVNLDSSVDIIDSSTIAKIERGADSVKMSTQGKASFFVFDEVISNYNVMKFKTRVDTLDEGWAAYGLRISTADKAIFAQGSYYFLIKPDIFELQKQGAIYQIAPNDGRFKFGEWNDIEFASITTTKGIHMFFKLNGEVIFDFIDTTEPNYTAGMFGVYNATANSTIEIAKADEVPTTLFERSEAIQRQLDSNATILYTDSDALTKSGNFLSTNNMGFNNTPAMKVVGKGDTASWKMVGESIDNGKNYKVSYYHIPSEKGDPNVKVKLDGYSGYYETTIDLSKGEKGWVELGTFQFQDSDYIGRLNITFEASGQGEMWLNAVEFAPLEGGVNMLTSPKDAK